jgi:hypothetical protein
MAGRKRHARRMAAPDREVAHGFQAAPSPEGRQQEAPRPQDAQATADLKPARSYPSSHSGR